MSHSDDLLPLGFVELASSDLIAQCMEENYGVYCVCPHSVYANIWACLVEHVRVLTMTCDGDPLELAFRSVIIHSEEYLSDSSDRFEDEGEEEAVRCQCMVTHSYQIVTSLIFVL